MKLMRKTAKYTRQDHKRNQEIMKELKTNPVLEKINNYKEKCIQHVHRMERSTFPRAILNYQPSGKRHQGRPLKRLLDSWKWGRNRPWGLNPWQHYDDDDFNVKNSNHLRTSL
jgi:hypothetical protein